MNEEIEQVETPPEEPNPLTRIFGARHEEHLAYLISLKPMRFILMGAIYLLVLKVGAALLIEVVTYPFPEWNPSGTVDPRKIMAEHGKGAAFVLGVFFAPLIETILGQWLPIRIARIWTSNPKILLWTATIVFAIQHLHAGLNGLAVGFGGGIALAFAFLVWYPSGFKKAYWITSAIHALHNGMAFIGALFV